MSKYTAIASVLFVALIMTPKINSEELEDSASTARRKNLVANESPITVSTFEKLLRSLKLHESRAWCPGVCYHNKMAQICSPTNVIREPNLCPSRSQFCCSKNRHQKEIGIDQEVTSSEASFTPVSNREGSITIPGLSTWSDKVEPIASSPTPFISTTDSSSPTLDSEVSTKGDTIENTVCPGVCSAKRISNECEAALDVVGLCSDNLRCCVSHNFYDGKDSVPKEFVLIKGSPSSSQRQAGTTPETEDIDKVFTETAKSTVSTSPAVRRPTPPTTNDNKCQGACLPGLMSFMCDEVDRLATCPGTRRCCLRSRKKENKGAEVKEESTSSVSQTPSTTTTRKTTQTPKTEPTTRITTTTTTTTKKSTTRESTTTTEGTTTQQTTTPPRRMEPAPNCPGTCIPISKIRLCRTPSFIITVTTCRQKTVCCDDREAQRLWKLRATTNNPPSPTSAAPRSTTPSTTTPIPTTAPPTTPRQEMQTYYRAPERVERPMKPRPSSGGVSSIVPQAFQSLASYFMSSNDRPPNRRRPNPNRRRPPPGNRIRPAAPPQPVPTTTTTTTTTTPAPTTTTTTEKPICPGTCIVPILSFTCFGNAELTDTFTCNRPAQKCCAPSSFIVEPEIDNTIETETPTTFQPGPIRDDAIDRSRVPQIPQEGPIFHPTPNQGNPVFPYQFYNPQQSHGNELQYPYGQYNPDRSSNQHLPQHQEIGTHWPLMHPQFGGGVPPQRVTQQPPLPPTFQHQPHHRQQLPPLQQPPRQIHAVPPPPRQKMPQHQVPLQNYQQPPPPPPLPQQQPQQFYHQQPQYHPDPPAEQQFIQEPVPQLNPVSDSFKPLTHDYHQSNTHLSPPEIRAQPLNPPPTSPAQDKFRIQHTNVQRPLHPEPANTNFNEGFNLPSPIQEKNEPNQYEVENVPERRIPPPTPQKQGPVPPPSRVTEDEPQVVVPEIPPPVRNVQLRPQYQPSESPIEVSSKIPLESIINSEPISAVTNSNKYVCGIKGSSPKGNRQGRVVGGEDADPGEWCWQVALINSQNQYLCGGALIGTQWVLTAAHCVTNIVRSGDSIYVRVGDHDLTTRFGSPGAQTLRVATTYIHHNHNSQTLDNDIALLKLSGHAELKKGVCLACLPARGVSQQAGKRCTVTGYGYMGESGPIPLRVREAEVPVVSETECVRKINAVTEKVFILPASSFCAGGESGHDACQGDGGGPLVCKVDDYYEVSGLVSWGFGCGRHQVPGVYVKVSSFIGWINQIISVNNHST